MDEERKRRYYSISDVARMMNLKPHILRFWETEFPMLKPRKNRAGNRAYTERDIKIVGLIRKLLYDEKFTIEGAKLQLKTNREILDDQLSLPLDTVTEMSRQSGTSAPHKELLELRGRLEELISMVEQL